MDEDARESQPEPPVADYMDFPLALTAKTDFLDLPRIPPDAFVMRADDRGKGQVQYKEYAPLPTDGGLVDQPPNGMRVHTRILTDVTINGVTDLRLYVLIANHSYDGLIALGELVTGSPGSGYEAVRLFKLILPARRYQVLEWSEIWPDSPLLTTVLGSPGKGQEVDFTIRVLKAVHMPTSVPGTFAYQLFRPGDGIKTNDTVVLTTNIAKPVEIQIAFESRLLNSSIDLIAPNIASKIVFFLPELGLADNEKFSIVITVPSDPDTLAFRTPFIYRAKPALIRLLNVVEGQRVKAGSVVDIGSTWALVPATVAFEFAGGRMSASFTTGALDSYASFRMADLGAADGTPFSMVFSFPGSPDIPPIVYAFVYERNT